MIHPRLDVRAFRKVLGITLFLELFYLTGHYAAGWPFPTPTVILHLFTVSGLGVALGMLFAKVWPISPQTGIERVLRTALLVIPALGLGIGIQVLLQGPQATQAIYLIFAFAAWFGSGHIMREHIEA